MTAKGGQEVSKSNDTGKIKQVIGKYTLNYITFFLGQILNDDIYYCMS